MAQDATGAPTTLGIPTYDTTVDAPSGKGFNAAMASIDTLLQSRVTVAGTAAWKTRLLSADANPAFQILGDGTHQWGAGGGSAVDTNLSRLSAGNLLTTSLLQIHRTAFTDTALATRQAGDSASRWFMRADGQMTWGDGTTTDTNLYRSGVNSLKTDDGFLAPFIDVGTATPGDEGLIMTMRTSRAWNWKADGADGGTQHLKLEDATGSKIMSFAGPTSQIGFLPDSEAIFFGGGTGAAGSGDVKLYRNAANELATDDAFVVIRAATGNAALNTRVSGDTNQRFQVNADGAINWGPGGASSPDVLLSRAAQDRLVLATGDALELGTATGTGQYLQLWEQTSQPAAPATNSVRIFAEDNGASKTRIVARFPTGTAVTIATEP